ncbi:MAG: YlxR family protein [Chloroflexota bacterium]
MPKRHPDHIPMRTCAVCRTVRPKRSMIRLVRTAERQVIADPTGRLAGRGTYVCDEPACRDPKRLAAAVQRALDAPVALDALHLEVN